MHFSNGSVLGSTSKNTLCGYTRKKENILIFLSTLWLKGVLLTIIHNGTHCFVMYFSKKQQGTFLSSNAVIYILVLPATTGFMMLHDVFCPARHVFFIKSYSATKLSFILLVCLDLCTGRLRPLPWTWHNCFGSVCIRIHVPDLKWREEPDLSALCIMSEEANK